jgi:hypothetical protein
MENSTIEARLRALEAFLSVTSETRSPEDVTSRIGALETKLNSLTSNLQGDTPLKQLWEESDKLMRELDPGTALTHQQQIAAPILYRRQEILASAESLRRDMGQLMEILTLLSIGQPQIIGEDPLSEMQVTKAPILAVAPPSKVEEERLQHLEVNLQEMHDKMKNFAARLDKLVAGYHSLVTAVSEKIVLVDETTTGK